MIAKKAIAKRVFMNFHPRSIVLLFILVLMAGCDTEPSGETVCGVVTIEGQPMTEGLITFAPMGTTTGPKVSALIDSGAYSVLSTEGIHAGLFRVEILGLPPGVKALASGGDHSQLSLQKSPYREVAAEFNFQSVLTANLESGVANQFDFQVQPMK
jgi:hypothetical protein